MTENEQAPRMRTVRSFVVRAGRLTDAQQSALATLWPLYGLEIEQGQLDQQAVFGRTVPLVFEIGFGMGASLIEMASAAPEQDFIGVEVHPPGVGTILRAIQDAGLRNLRIYQADAKFVLEQCMADDSLDKIQIFFPDPWHKKRHHKRRLIQPDFVQDIRKKLKPGGTLHLATDWLEYAGQMMTVMEEAEGFRNSIGPDQWATGHGRPATKFQHRGQRLGHGVWDLIFTRTA